MKIGILGLAVAVMAPTAMFSQSSGANSLPPGFVDGSKNPDQIPDSAARRLVLLSLALPASADQQAVSRQVARLKFIGLSGPDVPAAQAVIAQFGVQYSAWMAANGSGGSRSASQAPAAGPVEAVVEGAWAALSGRLTPGGAAALSRYLARAKSRMIVKP